ncbi:HdeD family acid-resistance protein (plasmid) [Kovacikia minuta CCNUW1]|uniref:HdeD family acid-resistance protein n=1 Tax=Kovacikia minuta TaxID=2931930 RepID=UPI001CC9F4FD|nr:HdeD family acid-resistance protein [Kovacikia minuta]UBF30017.1 HdeD family acid-resistance protein [Kovacikia minuta CCNUW1]
MKTEIINDVKQNTGWFIALGILMVILGIAAIVEPLVATIAVARVFSWIFLFAGVIRIIHAVQSRQERGFWPKLLIGILYVITGIVLLGNVFGAALSLTFALGWVILVQGILEVIAAFKVRPEPNWGWLLFSGVISIILGILILYRWPFNAVWLLGIFSGISFLFAGSWMIMLPWAARQPLTRNLI